MDFVLVSVTILGLGQVTREEGSQLTRQVNNPCSRTTLQLTRHVFFLLPVQAWSTRLVKSLACTPAWYTSKMCREAGLRQGNHHARFPLNICTLGGKGAERVPKAARVQPRPNPSGGGRVKPGAAGRGERFAFAAHGEEFEQVDEVHGQTAPVCNPNRLVQIFGSY